MPSDVREMLRVGAADIRPPDLLGVQRRERSLRRRGALAKAGGLLTGAVVVLLAASLVWALGARSSSHTVKTGLSSPHGVVVHASYVPAGLHRAPLGTVGEQLFGTGPSTPTTAHPKIELIPPALIPPTTNSRTPQQPGGPDAGPVGVAGTGWVAPGRRVGIQLTVFEGTPTQLAQVAQQVGSQTTTFQLGDRHVQLAISPIVDGRPSVGTVATESIATWYENPHVVALVNSRGITTSDLTRFIRRLQFSNLPG